MISISVFAKKGGVGKTTLAFNLAGFLATQNYRVLLIDCDSQASLSQGILGADVVERLRLQNTVAALFDDVVDADPEELVHETTSENIFLVPTSDFLDDANRRNPRDGEYQYQLQEFTHQIQSHADFVIFDTPPNCSLLPAWASLMASSFVLCPVIMEAFSAQSVPGVIRKIQEAQENGNPNLELLGYVVSKRVKRRAVHEAYEAKMRKLYGSQVIETVIPDWIPFAESQAKQQHIFDYAPNTDSTAVMAALGQDILNRLPVSSVGRAA